MDDGLVQHRRDGATPARAALQVNGFRPFIDQVNLAFLVLYQDVQCLIYMLRYHKCISFLCITGQSGVAEDRDDKLLPS